MITRVILSGLSLLGLDSLMLRGGHGCLDTREEYRLDSPRREKVGSDCVSLGVVLDFSVSLDVLLCHIAEGYRILDLSC